MHHLPLNYNDFGGPLPAFIMLIEICYDFQETKKSPVQKSWTYFNPGTDDLDKATKKATTYFKSFVRDNGLTKKATLTEIKRLNNATSKTPIVSVNADVLAPARSRSKSTPTPKRKRRTKK